MSYTFRQWRHAPLFAVVSIALIAIGIGANTAIFTLVDALLLRPLPVRDPQTLVRFITRRPPLPDTSAFTSSYERLLREKPTSFSDAICQFDVVLPVTADGVAEFVRVGPVTNNFFDMLGARAGIGRLFSERDTDKNTAVLSDRYWRSRFGADARVIGRGIQVSGATYTIIGVTAAEFHGTTVEMNPEVRIPRFQNTGCDLVARLKPGVSLERAAAEALSLHTADKAEAEWHGQFLLIPIEQGVSVLRDQFGGSLQMLMAGVGLVLLMVCSNVAGLLLERVAARDKEIAIRLALGAPRWRLFAQWMTETALLALFGGLGGVALARVLLPVLTAMIPPLRNRSGDLLVLDPAFHLNWRVMGFSFAACLMAVLLAGISPALRAGRQDLQTALRSKSGMRPVESVLTVFQVAMCTLLLIAAVIFLQTLREFRAMDPGFDRDHVIAFTIEPSANVSKWKWDELVRSARELAGVQSAAMASLGLMRGTGMKTTAGLPGEILPESQFANTSMNGVSPEYFETMGIRVVSGRTFDRNDSGKTAVINETFSKKVFRGVDPIGKAFGTGTKVALKPEQVVIGVVSDARYRSLKEPIPPTFYTIRGSDEFGHILHVRSAGGDPSQLTSAVRELVQRVMPGSAIREVNLLREEVERTLWRERLVAELAAAFAGIASLLAAIGLYGTLAYYVARRRRDIGIRVAIGAPRSSIVWLLCGRVGALVGVGLVVGSVAAVAASSYFEHPRYSAVGIAVAGVVLIALMAAVVPAWRALGIDPMVALREE